MTNEKRAVLLNHTPLSVCCRAIRTCYDSFKGGGIYNTLTDEISEKDKQLMIKVIKKNKHGSTSEHLVYQFHIKSISRALLQELARHRHASLSVRSTRYTLSQLAKISDIEFKNLGDYCILTGDIPIDNNSYLALANLQQALKKGIKNDKAKFCLPESFRTELIYTINARSLQNFLTLRTNPSAMWEIRLLAKEMYEQLPESHRFLFDIYEDDKRG